VFFRRKPAGDEPDDPPVNMQLAMIFFAVLCLVAGVFPSLLYALLPHPVDYAPYTGTHVAAQLELLLLSALAFFVMLPLMKRAPAISLDTDWFYRRLPALLGALAAAPAAALRRARAARPPRRAPWPALAALAQRDPARLSVFIAVVLAAVAALLLLHY